MFFTCSKLIRSVCGPNHRFSVTLDDIFFRLYYRFTCSILLLTALVILLREWSIDSIDCSVPASVLPLITAVGSEVSHYRINTYCKLHNRFLPVNSINNSNNQCLSPSNATFENPKPWTQIPKYQWFALILFSSAVVIYLPHLIWKCCNGSMVKTVAGGRFRRSRSLHRFGSPDQQIKTHLQTSTPSHQHLFTFLYLLLKLLNSAFLFALIYLTNYLLSNQFLYFPIYFFEKLQNSNQESLIDGATQIPNCTTLKPLESNGSADLFPKSSLCPYTYLETANQKTQTILVSCLMPINSLLEQAFLFLWFWFALVALFTLLDFTRYILLILFRPLRTIHLKYSTNSALTHATYKLCSTSFSSWLFTTIVLLNNQNYGGFWYQKKGHRSLEVIEEDEEEEEDNSSNCNVLYESIELQEIRNKRSKEGGRRTNV